MDITKLMIAIVTTIVAFSSVGLAQYVKGYILYNMSRSKESNIPKSLISPLANFSYFGVCIIGLGLSLIVYEILKSLN